MLPDLVVWLSVLISVFAFMSQWIDLSVVLMLLSSVEKVHDLSIHNFIVFALNQQMRLEVILQAWKS